MPDTGLETAIEFAAMIVGKYFATVAPVSPAGCDQRQHEGHATSGADRSRRVPENRAQPDTEQTDLREVRPRQHHGTEHPRL